MVVFCPKWVYSPKNLGARKIAVGYLCSQGGDFYSPLHREIIQRTTETTVELGGKVDRDPKTDLLLLNDELAISLVIARCQTSENGMQRWRIRFDTHAHDPDLTVAVRLDSNNELELDYYLLQRLDLPTHEIRVSTRNSVQFECFRFDNLGFFYGMSEREPLIPKTFEHIRKERNDLPSVPKTPTSANPKTP